MRAVVIALPILLGGMLASLGEARAWGEFGHLTVCDLAYRNLTDKTREELDKLFQVDAGGITVKDRWYTSFNVGCLEEDERPRKHPSDHFINVDRTTTAIVDGSCPPNADCILSGIGRDLAIVKDTSRSNEDRVFALMAVGHWLGDIHQPLHISFADDSGGNAIRVKLKGKCGTSNYRPNELHGVWDNCLLEAGLFERVRQRADFKPKWSRRTITYRAVDSLQANTTQAEEKALVGTDPWIWANESFQVTLKPDTLYCTVVGDKCQYSPTEITLQKGADQRLQPIDQAYLKAHESLAEERVKKAGFRLAHLMNLALDPAYSEPVQNSTQQP